MADYRRPYLDSGVWIDFLAGPEGQGTTPDRATIAREIFDGAEQGRFKIVCSTLVAVEVLRDPQITDERVRDVEGFFGRSCFVWIELTLPLALAARAMGRRHRLRPPDAVHLATAVHGECDAFMTVDRADFPSGEYEGLPVSEPRYPFPRSLPLEVDLAPPGSDDPTN